MRPSRRHELAERVCQHRARLEQTLLEIAERGTALSKTEARLIIEAADLRLAEVERELRCTTLRFLGIPTGRLRRFLRRLRGLFQPRIGRLQHYPARPLQLPASYQRAKPPQPAPVISVVTPSFQHGRFIERTIESVVGQDYPALEYIVQDGGSTDETIDILERVSDRLTRWASAPDDGQAEALNRGFQWTTGEIMGWLNSDDLLLPGSLACIAQYFMSHPETDVVYGNRVMIDDNDGQIGAWILPPHDDLALTLADYIPQETLFWRRPIWDAAGGGLDEDFSYALDWDLLLRFRNVGARMVRLPRYLGAFRIHKGQTTSLEHALGLAEMARLRERVHGRPVELGEVHERLRPYLRRHVGAHVRQRVVERLPIARVRVDIRSTERRSIPGAPAQNLIHGAPARK